MIVFDIETGPQEQERVLAAVESFVAPESPGVFDPASVKYGQTKDPEKRAAKLAEVKAAHEARVAAFDQEVELLHRQWVANAMSNAALSPVTGRVLSIGMKSERGEAIRHSSIPGGDNEYAVEAEASTLESFWMSWTKWRDARRPVVGINIREFDLPFLVRRSWILGVDVPAAVRVDRYWDKSFVDLRDVWLLGQRWSDCPSSLDHVARSLGIGGKNGNGSDYAKLWASDRAAAEEYLRCDLDLTWKVAERLGVVG